MKIVSFGAAMCVALFAASAGFAQQVKASEPESIMNYFQELGAPVKLTEDKVGDPMIELQYYGTKMVIFFYGCSDNKNCNALQFYAGYTADSEISPEALNTWNADNRYGRAYRSENGSKRLEYDIYTGNDGVSLDDFDEVFDIWTHVVESFEDELS